MVLGTFFLSFGSVFIKVAGNTYPTMQIIFVRSLVTFMYCFFMINRAGLDLLGYNRKLLILRGILGFCAYYCFFYAVIHLSLAEGTVLVFTFPVLVPILAYLTIGEKLEWMSLVCILLGLAGVIMVAKPGIFFAEDTQLDHVAVSIALAGSLISAFVVVIIRNLAMGEHSLVIVLYTGAFGCIAAPAINGWTWILPDIHGLLMLLGVGVCASLGQHMMTKAFRHGTATGISGLFYLEVLFSVIWGFLLFDEKPGLWTICGAGAIAIAALSIGLCGNIRGKSLSLTMANNTIIHRISH